MQVTAQPYQAIHCPKRNHCAPRFKHFPFSRIRIYRSDILVATLDTVQRRHSRPEGKRNNCQVVERVRNTVGNRVSKGTAVASGSDARGRARRAQSASANVAFGSVHARADSCCRSMDLAHKSTPTDGIQGQKERGSQSGVVRGGASETTAVSLSLSVG